MELIVLVMHEAQVYLQMRVIMYTTRAVFRKFLCGHHVIRRSDRFWAGLSTDLTIEQVLMRSLKVSGGLTRGTGMGEAERSVWLLCMPACSEISVAMQDVTEVSLKTSEQHVQHKDSSASRQRRDHQDTTTILLYLQPRNPFSEVHVLIRSIATGRDADPAANPDKAKEIGDQILKSMTGKVFSDVTFTKKNQAKTMVSGTVIKTKNETVTVDPNLLFQRLTKAAEKTPNLLEDSFKYKLTNVPSSLFDAHGLPRKAKKAALADYIWSSTKQVSACIPSGAYSVVDGGFLLHRLPWPSGSTYSEIIAMYSDFVTQRYKQVSIVFDGYSMPSTKDAAHLHRTKQNTVTVDIAFQPDMTLCGSKEQFLASPSNKQRFIDLLSLSLQNSGFEVLHATGDADCLIVKTVIDKAAEIETVLVGEDTDLLVLLLYHLRSDHNSVYFTSSGSRKDSKVWDIQCVQLQQTFGRDVGNRVCFSHAFGGTDTTSAVFMWVNRYL